MQRTSFRSGTQTWLKDTWAHTLLNGHTTHLKFQETNKHPLQDAVGLGHHVRYSPSFHFLVRTRLNTFFLSKIDCKEDNLF